MLPGPPESAVCAASAARAAPTARAACAARAANGRHLWRQFRDLGYVCQCGDHLRD